MYERSPDVPSPISWGWRRNQDMRWEPHWTDLPEATSYSGLLLLAKKGALDAASELRQH